MARSTVLRVTLQHDANNVSVAFITFNSAVAAPGRFVRSAQALRWIADPCVGVSDEWH